MQRITLILFAILFTIPAFAQRERSMLKIRDMEGRKITVEINGRRYNRVGRILTFKDLPPRNHRLKVYVVRRKSNGTRKARLIYQGRVRTRPNKIYYVTVDDYEKLDIITDCCLDDAGPWDEPHAWYRSRYYDQQDWEDDIQFDPQHDTYYNYDEDEDRPKERRRRYKKDDWEHYKSGMSNARFNELLENIREAGFESERLTIVKIALKNNNLNTRQLVQIMKAMSFESSRLNVAKMAYDKIVDKENSYRINEGFSFTSSKDDFRLFLESRTDD